jgi:2-polyprenyl-3-methyl-5-hydroxy-6-metoxy-1,4-benzoquinol methylase
MYITISKPEDMPNIIGYRIPDWYEQERFEKTIEIVGSGKNVLDLGCGLGVLSLEIAFQGNDVVAVDADCNLINEASRYSDKYLKERKINNVYILKCENGEELSLPDESFDTVLIEEVLEHVPNPMKIIKEAIRVLKKGGILIISVPNEGNLPDPDHINIFSKSYFEFLEDKTWIDIPDIWLMFKWIKK